MGTFTLCVENTSREVCSLLELHKVHPQVRKDVQRQLAALVSKSYELMKVTKPGYQESSEQVCRAITSQLVDHALTVAIPRSELAIKEKENAALQQELVDLRNERIADANKAAQTERSLAHLRAAHDYMLHSYFKEVLILRHRIRNLETRPTLQKNSSFSRLTGLSQGPLGSAAQQSPERSAGATDCGSSAYTSEVGSEGSGVLVVVPRPTVHGVGELRAVDRGQNSTSSDSADRIAAGAAPLPMSVLGDVLAQVGTLSYPSKRASGKTRATDSHDAAGELPPTQGVTPAEPIQGSLSTSTCPSSSASSSLSPTQSPSVHFVLTSTQAGDEKGNGGDSIGTAPPAPAALTRSLLTSSRSAPAAADGSAASPVGTVTTVTDMLHAISTHSVGGSVDAIFDYEAYLALLNGDHDASGDGASTAADERNSLRMQLLRERRKHRLAGRYGLAEEDPAVARMRKDLEFYRVKASKTKWCLLFAVHPLKLQLLREIAALRAEVEGMRAAHAGLFATMNDVTALMHSRCSALVELFAIFTTEVGNTLTSMRKDASAKTCAELFLSSGKRRNQLEAIFTAASSPAGVDEAGGAGADGMSRSLLRRFLPWLGHEVTRRARDTLTALEKFADRTRQKRAYLLSKGGEGVEESYTRLLLSSGESERAAGRVRRAVSWLPPQRSGERSAEDGQPDTSPGAWRSTAVKGLRGRTGTSIVREMCRLRMRRACNRVRRSHIVNRILGLECAEAERQAQVERDGADGDAEAAAQAERMYEDVHGAYQGVCRTYERAIMRDTRHLHELLRALASHLYRCGAPLSELLAAVPREEEPDTSLPAHHRYFLSSYLCSPGTVGSARAAAAASERSLLYAPVGTGPTSAIFFQNEEVPISAFYTASSAEPAGAVPYTFRETRSPYGAAVDYCTGVQRGMPMGTSFGPVYLHRTHVPGEDPTGSGDGEAYCITDAHGAHLMREAAEAERRGVASTAELRSGGPDERAAAPLPSAGSVPMTQILFPAPRPPLTGAATPSTLPSHAGGQPYIYHTAPTGMGGGDGVAAPLRPASDLGPLYLVPLTTPATEAEQMRSGFGHTAKSSLFAVAESEGGAGVAGAGLGGRPVPATVSTSYTHLMDPTGGGGGGGRNPYLFVPPRVCRPPTEEAAMLRIQSLHRPPPPPPPPPAAASALAGATGPTSPAPAQAGSPQPSTLAEGLTPLPPTSVTALGGSECSTDLAPPTTASPALLPYPSAGELGAAGESLAETACVPSSPPPPATTPAPAALASFGSALQQAKERRAARLERVAAESAAARAQRLDSWARQTANAGELSGREKFLRLRLPGAHRLAPIAPSPRDTCALQEKMRLPRVSLVPATASSAALGAGEPKQSFADSSAPVAMGGVGKGVEKRP